MRYRIRQRKDRTVDYNKPFSAKLVGGGRGFKDCMALEPYSNAIAPTITAMSEFKIIVEPDEPQDS